MLGVYFSALLYRVPYMKTILFLTAHPSEQKVLASHVKQYSFPGMRFQFANL